jgi:hypothetical protein
MPRNKALAKGFLHSLRLLPNKLVAYVNFVHKTPIAIVTTGLFLAAVGYCVHTATAITAQLSEKRAISLKIEHFWEDIQQVDQEMLAAQDECNDSLLRATDFVNTLVSSHHNREPFQRNELDQGKMLNRIARSKLAVQMAKERALNPQTPALQETLRGSADDDMVVKDILDRLDQYYDALEDPDPTLMDRLKGEDERQAQSLGERLDVAVEKSKIRKKRIYSLVKEMGGEVTELKTRLALIRAQQLLLVVSGLYIFLYLSAIAFYFILFLRGNKHKPPEGP